MSTSPTTPPSAARTEAPTLGARLRAAVSRSRTLWPAREDYRLLPRTWRQDLVAGVTVGIVALPLALGFGVSSGLTAEQGLVTAIVAGLLAAVFGGSNVQVSGPTGAMVVVLLPIVANYGAEAIIAVTLLAGLMVTVTGLLRLGKVVSIIPWPVIEGFTLGIACIIFLQQIPQITTATPAEPGELSTNALIAAVQSLAHADAVHLVWAIGAALIVAAVMVIAPRIHPSIPGSLIGIAVVAVLAWLLPTPLATIGTIPASIPAPSLPVIDPEMLGVLLPAAATVAALAAIESLLSARVAGSMADTGAFDPDRELVGQGIASIGASLFGGMPATGAIARTSVSIRAGARTRAASIMHALVLLAVVYVASGPVGMIPLAALAGVLFMTALRMVNVRVARSIMTSTRSDAWIFAVTALITVSFDLIWAVLIGVVLAAIVALRAASRSTGVGLERIEADAPSEYDDAIVAVTFRGPLFFVSSDRVFETVMAVGRPTVVILRLARLERVDASGAQVLAEIVRGLERRGVTVLIKGVQDTHSDLFHRVGVLAALRHHKHLFMDFEGALEHARSHVDRARRPAEA